MSEKLFLNDKLIDAADATVSASDGGLLYGAGLFETMRSRNGVVFALNDHLDRLFFSSAALAIDIPYDQKYLTKAVNSVLEANNLTDARIRLTITTGPVSAAAEHKPTLLITAAELAPYPPQFYEAGVLAVLSPYRQNPADPTHGHKTTSYYPRLLALKKAHALGAAEAIWFTVEGYLAEGCISNVFLVKDSMLHTPPVETPVLSGVARKTVCRIAVENSIALVEKPLSIEDCLAADEIFLTNVMMQVMPVNALEKHSVADGKPGPLTTQIRQKYTELFESTCEPKK